MWAMSTLGFEDYIEPLKIYLAKYLEVGAHGTTAAPSAPLARRCTRFNVLPGIRLAGGEADAVQAVRSWWTSLRDQAAEGAPDVAVLELELRLRGPPRKHLLPLEHDHRPLAEQRLKSEPGDREPRWAAQDVAELGAHLPHAHGVRGRAIVDTLELLRTRGVGVEGATLWPLERQCCAASEVDPRLVLQRVGHQANQIVAVNPREPLHGRECRASRTSGL